MNIASLPVAANPGPHAQALATGLDSVMLQGEVTIVQGTVLRIASAFEGDLIFSYVTVMVAEVVSGLDSLRGIETIVRHLGGEVNGVLLWASDQPYFAIGEIVQLSVRLEGDYYVAISPKTTVVPPPDALPTAEGYRLYWYHPSLGWRYQASSPGSGWYDPAKWFGGGFTYYVNTANTPTSVGSANFISAVQASYQTWEDDPGSSVDLTYGGTTSGTVDNHDQVPRVGWGPIGGSTIAYTHIWMTLGSGYTLPMDDADMVFDTTKSWSVTGAPGTYDVQNIGTHEAGHAIGLADLYDSEDSEQTMFGYASTGETKKRTLKWGDRAGVAALYPSAGYRVTFRTNPTSFVGSSGSITVDGSSTYTNGQTGSYMGTHNVNVNVPSDYQFFWVYGNRNPFQNDPTSVYVPNISNNPTTKDANGNGWLKAEFSAKITFYTNPSAVGSISWGSCSNPGKTNGQTTYDGARLFSPSRSVLRRCATCPGITHHSRLFRKIFYLHL
jgi:hypothetical protein